MIINFLDRSSDRTGDGSVVNPDMRTSIPVSSTGKAERILRASGNLNGIRLPFNLW